MESHFEGMPKVSDFKLAKETKGDEAALKSGEIRTEALFWSVDPYMRIYPRAFGFPVPMTMIGSQVAKVSAKNGFTLKCSKELDN